MKGQEECCTQLLLTVLSEVMTGAVAGVAPGRAGLPGAGRLVFTRVQRTRFGTGAAIVTCERGREGESERVRARERKTGSMTRLVFPCLVSAGGQRR